LINISNLLGTAINLSQQFSAYNPERSESDQESQWGGSPLTDSTSPHLLDHGEASEASCAYRLYPDSGPLGYGLHLSEEDLAHAQGHAPGAACDRTRCQGGRYFLGAPQLGREAWWDATRSVLSLPKAPGESGEGYDLASYHGAIHGEGPATAICRGHQARYMFSERCYYQTC
jgi:single-minded-like protein